MAIPGRGLRSGGLCATLRGARPTEGAGGGGALEAGDFAARVAPHAASVARMLRRLLPSREDAEDVYQETLLHAFLGLATLSRAELFGPWLRTIAYNRAMEWQRRRYAEAAARIRLVPPSGGCGGIEEVAAARVDVAVALRLLRPEDRRLVLLRYRDCWPAAVIARRLGVPPATVRSRLRRARQRLRRTLK